MICIKASIVYLDESSTSATPLFDWVQWHTTLARMLLNLEGRPCFIVRYLSLSLNLLQTPVKPPLKEPTEPIDLVLHSDVRAIGRAKFDHQVSCPLRCSLAVEEFLRAMHRLSSILQVAERSSFIEEVKLERERQLKVYHITIYLKVTASGIQVHLFRCKN